MRIFMTGAAGWIGSASLRSLVASGHDVVGLARSDAAAAAIEGSGGQVVRGDLQDIEVLRAEAERSDGVIHLAFRHDIAFSGDFAGAAASDLQAITAFGEVLAGSGRPLLIASGVPSGGNATAGVESDRPDASTHPRIASADATLALADRGVRSVVIRFAPTVHGQGDKGFIASLVNTARERGVSGYVADGRNRWPAVHRDDAADLVHRAFEHAQPGAVLHATAESGVETRAIAESIGRALGLPVESVPADQAMTHFGFLGLIFSVDLPTSSEVTQRMLGWTPTGPTLLEDIDEGRYTSATAR